MPDVDFLTATRTSYDEVAETVAEAWRHDLDVKPWERTARSVFAELVGPGGRVADVGCGPGDGVARCAGTRRRRNRPLPRHVFAGFAPALAPGGYVLARRPGSGIS